MSEAVSLPPGGCCEGSVRTCELLSLEGLNPNSGMLQFLLFNLFGEIPKHQTVLAGRVRYCVINGIGRRQRNVCRGCGRQGSPAAPAAGGSAEQDLAPGGCAPSRQDFSFSGEGILQGGKRSGC